MTNLSIAQSELLKYLQSQILKTNNLIKDEKFLLDFEIGWYSKIETAYTYDKNISKLKIEKYTSNLEVLEFRFQWLIERLNVFVPAEVKP
jgi:hypothetical protein